MGISRRRLLSGLGLGMAGWSMSGWLPEFAQALAPAAGQRRHCVLLWMTGGPSQTDTFDMKPEAPEEVRGEFEAIETSVPGVRFSEHLPRLARLADHLAVVRSLSTKEGDHGRGTFLMRTGRQPTGPIRYPTIGSALSKELGSEEAELPAYVSIAPYRAFNRAAFSPGFLGPRHAPLTVGASDSFQQIQQQQAEGTYAELGVDDLGAAGAGPEQVRARLELWRTLESEFVSRHRAASPIAHETVYERAVRMMQSEAAKAFDLSEESDKVRDRYGPGRFGQGCLMARRLIERGVPFVEVSLGSFGGGTFAWDTHRQNFPTVERLCAELDAGWATLMEELAERGLLERTTFIWLGEFGRTPKVNRNAGRDHYPRAWSCVLGGAGIRGGQAYGSTSPDGADVAENKTDVPEVLATLAAALRVDPHTQNISGVSRPIRIADGEPIADLLA